MAAPKGIEECKGDIFGSSGGKDVVLIHATCIDNHWCGGFIKSLDAVLPQVGKAYMNEATKVMGDVLAVPIGDWTVLNMHCINGGTMDLEALSECLDKVAEYMETFDKGSVELRMPRIGHHAARYRLDAVMNLVTKKLGHMKPVLFTL